MCVLVPAFLCFVYLTLTSVHVPAFLHRLRCHSSAARCWLCTRHCKARALGGSEARSRSEPPLGGLSPSLVPPLKTGRQSSSRSTICCMGSPAFTSTPKQVMCLLVLKLPAFPQLFLHQPHSTACYHPHIKRITYLPMNCYQSSSHKNSNIRRLSKGTMVPCAHRCL